MIVRLEFDPQEASYQFLYEIAIHENNPDNLDEIYSTVNNFELRPSDCIESWEFTPYDADCTAGGVKEVIAINPNTPLDTMMRMAHEPDELLRAIIAVHTHYEEVMNILANDSHIYVVKNLLENKNLTKDIYDKIVENFAEGKYDFEVHYNKAKEISMKQFVKFLSKHKYAR